MKDERLKPVCLPSAPSALAMLTIVPFVGLRLVLVLECVIISGIKSEVPILSRKVSTMLEEGKRQYNLIQTKTTLPALGSCWKKAVSHLNNGCNHLDDNIQSDIALGFANCFLEGAGLPRHECDSMQISAYEPCLKSMSDRAFLAYTEFFTHTQSMCFFIMSQLWHEETEQIIDRLSLSAADVARQLEATEELQVELLSQQQRSVALQQELVDNGLSLGNMLHESRDSLALIFTEFKSSTLEQQRLLGMVFHHLSALQSWVVGEVSWLDSVAFYIPSLLFVYFLTSAQRTANARIPSFLILVIAGFLERLTAYILLQLNYDHGTLQSVNILNECLNWWIWLIRRSTVTIITVALGVHLYKYHDREEIMHQLLQRIQSQNEELLKYIRPKRIQIGRGWPRMDEPDGPGYIAVPASCSSSRSSNSSCSSISKELLIKPIPTRLDGRIRSVIFDKSDNSTTQSPFRPIKDELNNIDATSLSVSIDLRPEQAECDGFVHPSSSIKSNSTPRRKTARDPCIEKSPTSSHYNLRRTRVPTPSL